MRIRRGESIVGVGFFLFFFFGMWTDNGVCDDLVTGLKMRSMRSLNLRRLRCVRRLDSLLWTMS